MALPILFYFPWREASGGPVYLTTIARELSKTYPGTIYYTDYENGLSDSMLEGTSVKKLTVRQGDFSVNVKEPVIFVTPLYWAHWMPVIHPESKILFIDWHNLCLPVLRDSWKIDPERLKAFLQIISKSRSVMFCDAAHREALNSYGVNFDPIYVPIGVEASTTVKTDFTIDQKHLKIAILGRLSIDKVFAVTNLAKHFEEFNFPGKKTLYVIGSGPEQHRIIAENYPSVEVVFTGPLFNEKLNDFLVENVDVMFAMGTSALMSASLGIPTVVVCHEMHEYPDDAFVFLDQVKGYCLGWQCEQVKTLDMPALTLKEVFTQILDPATNRKIVRRGIQYVHEKHSPAFAAKKFLEATKATSLTWGKANSTFRSWIMVRRRLLPFGSKHTLWYTRSKNDVHEFYYGSRLLIRGRNEGVWKLLYRAFLKANRVRCLTKHNIARAKLFLKAFSRADRLVLENLARIAQQQRTISEQLNNKIQALTNQVNEQKSLIQHLTQANTSSTRAINARLDKQSDDLLLLSSQYDEQFNAPLPLHQNASEQLKALERLSAPSHTVKKQNARNTITGKPGTPNNSPEQVNPRHETPLAEQTEKLFSNEIEKKYLALAQSMDAESQLVVTRVLQRLWQYAGQPKYDLQVTHKEEQNYRKILNFHHNKTLQLDDGWFLYSGEYFLPPSDIPFEEFHYKYCVPDLTHPERLRTKAIIDVGASVGTSALVLREFTNEDIWAIEPDQHNFALLKQMIARNNLKNVRPLNVAIGAKSPTMKGEKHNDQTSPKNSLGEVSSPSKSEAISLQTIDSLVQECKINTGLIKIDVDGSALQVLIGGRNTIVTQKPALLISMNHHFEQFFQAKKWLESLNLDYTFKVRKPCNLSATMGVCLICEAR